jgi:hypothetical protein
MKIMYLYKYKILIMEKPKFKMDILTPTFSNFSFQRFSIFRYLLLFQLTHFIAGQIKDWCLITYVDGLGFDT